LERRDFDTTPRLKTAQKNCTEPWRSISDAFTRAGDLRIAIGASALLLFARGGAWMR
jgi:hypothetical protein